MVFAFNAVAEARDDFAKTFLLIAPNVIVFERLRIDFEGAAIFNADPIIPDALRIYWDFQCYMRDEGERASSLGALYLANVQQFYERPRSKTDEPEIMTEVLGPKPPVEPLAIVDFDKRIAERGGPIIVLNDEAHHTHDEESEWNKLIRILCMPKSAWGLVLEKVEEKIGAPALRRIILRAYEESDLKRGVAILDREK